MPEPRDDNRTDRRYPAQLDETPVPELDDDFVIRPARAAEQPRMPRTSEPTQQLQRVAPRRPAQSDIPEGPEGPVTGPSGRAATGSGATSGGRAAPRRRPGSTAGRTAEPSPIRGAEPRQRAPGSSAPRRQPESPPGRQPGAAPRRRPESTPEFRDDSAGPDDFDAAADVTDRARADAGAPIRSRVDASGRATAGTAPRSRPGAAGGQAAADMGEKQRKITAGRTTSRRERGMRRSFGCLGAFVWVVLVITVSLSAAAVILFSAADFLGLNRNSTVTVVIANGMTTGQVAYQLKQAGAINYPSVFELYVSFKKANGKLKTGVYTFNTDIGYDGIISQMRYGPGTESKILKIRIPEGASVDEIAALMDTNGVCTKAAFLNAVNKDTFDYPFLQGANSDKVYYKLEGYLYPDTYEFYADSAAASSSSSAASSGSASSDSTISPAQDTAAQRAIRTMLDGLASKLTTDDYAAAQTAFPPFLTNMSQVITLASIVDKEANGDPDNMAKVSAVFRNRLLWKDQPNLIGSTPTSLYAPGGRTQLAYNTIKVPGLPPGPICSPDISAIRAVLRPDSTYLSAYYYFVTDKNKQFYYMKTPAEFEAQITKLKNQGLWATQ